MRALCILPAEGFGGAERQGLLHIENLPKAGIDVVAVTGPGQSIRTELNRAGIKNYFWCADFPDVDIDTPGLVAGVARPWRYLRAWWQSTRKILALARDSKFDVILASRAFGWIVGGCIGRRLGLPVIWRAGSMPMNCIQRLMLRHLAPLIAPTLLVANSEIGRGVYRRLLHVPTAVLPNGVDTQRFNPTVPPSLRGHLKLEAVPVIGLAARPAPGKGLEFLAEVARVVISRHPSARFLVAGEFPWRRFYQEHFAKLGLEQNTHFLGHVPEIETFYASCDVIVLTSRRGSIEMSSNAVLEAMSTGRPVVATDVGGISEIVEDGVNGMLVSPDDPAAFAEAVSHLVDEPHLRNELGAAGRARILRGHSPEAVIETLKSLLQAARVLGSSPAILSASDPHAILRTASPEPGVADGLTTGSTSGLPESASPSKKQCVRQAT